MTIKDKVVVVTGGGGVLCGTLAAGLAQEGAKVAVLDLNLDKALEVADQITQQGGTAIGLAVDVLSVESLRTAHSILLKKIGACDILINGAGGNHPNGTTSKSHFDPDDIKLSSDTRTFFNLDTDGIQFVFNLNFIGTLLPTQVFAKDMVGRQGCSIINISSMNAYRPLTKIPAYSGAKAAVSNFTQWLAVYLAPVGIRVNAIAPGFFLTDQNRNLLMNSDGTLTNRGETILDHTPMGRFGEAVDLIGTTIWLTSDQSKFITGIIVPVDGGFSAFSGV